MRLLYIMIICFVQLTANSTDLALSWLMRIILSIKIMRGQDASVSGYL